MFNDRYVLITFVLKIEIIFSLIDKLGNSLSPIPAAPDQARIGSDNEFLAVPIRIEAVQYFLYFLRITRNNCIVARFFEIFWGPIQGFNERDFLIKNHGLFMRDIKIRIGIFYFN